MQINIFFLNYFKILYDILHLDFYFRIIIFQTNFYQKYLINPKYKINIKKAQICLFFIYHDLYLLILKINNFLTNLLC